MVVDQEMENRNLQIYSTSEGLFITNPANSIFKDQTLAWRDIICLTSFISDLSKEFLSKNVIT